MRVAQHISRYAEAHRCSWLPKCSGLNATRHRATRRDTRISPSRDQRDPRDIALHGKHHPNTHANHDPDRGIGVRPAQYLLPRLPASRPWRKGSHSDRRNRAAMARHFGANSTAHTDDDLVTNRAATRGHDACPCLDHRHGQYLDSYLTQGIHLYRRHHLTQNHLASRDHATRAYRVQGPGVYRTRREQINTRRDERAALARVCNAIVAELVGRVAYPTTSGALSPIMAQVLDAVEPRMIAWIRAPATASVMITADFCVCTTAGPQVPRHTNVEGVAAVVNRVRKPVASWMSPGMGERIDDDVAGTGVQRIEATTQYAVWRAV